MVCVYWDAAEAYLRDRIANGRELTEALDALSYFRTLLGDDWGSDPRNLPPLSRDLCGRELDMPYGVVYLHRLIAPLKSDPALNEVLGDLIDRDWNKYMAARQVLELAGRLAARCNVVLIRRNPPEKTPDFRVRLVERWVAFESTGLFDPEPTQIADEVRRQLNEWALGIQIADTWFVDVEFNCVAAEALQQLEAIKQEVLRLIRQKTSHVAGAVGSTRITVFNDRGPLPVRTHGIIVERFGSIDERLDFRKIVDKIRKKAPQATKNEPTVLFVRNRSLFDTERHQLDAALPILSRELRRALRRRRAVAACMDFELWGGTQPLTRREFAGDEFRYRADMTPRGENRVALFVPNPNANRPLSEQEVETLIGPNMCW